MSDLIDRDKAMKVAMWFGTSERKYHHSFIKKRVMEIPYARPKGEWIVYEGGWKDLDYYPPKCKCNQCGYEEELYILNAKPTNFCPNCGSDNREREDE